MSTAGLELSSFINPKLSWKIVSKGRSTSRRSRRLVLKNLKMGHEQNKSPKRVESQVTGVARRFGNSMEHIPIKKRRFLFQSPSPSPQSPCDELGELERNSCVSDQPTISMLKKIEDNSSNVVETSILDADDSSSDGKKLKATDEVCCVSDDFSGIAILADACIDMLDKPSANTMSANDEPVIKELINSPKEHIIEEPFRATICVTIQTTERRRTSTTSRDDRLHWDLNAPMDEWDQPLDDTIVDSSMKLKTENVVCLVKKEQASVRTVKESTLQSSVGRVNTFNTGNCGLTAGEALSESTNNSSESSQIQVVGKVETFQQHGIVPSSCMKDRFNPFGISNDQVVDRFEMVDHCLRLGSNDCTISVSVDKSIVTTGDLQAVSKEGSALQMQVDDIRKSEMDLLLKPESMEADFDTDIATCEVVKNTTKITKEDKIKNELPELSFHPLQHYSMKLSPTVGASVDETLDKGFTAVSQLNDNNDLVEMFKYSEIKTTMNNAMDQPSVSNQLDAKKCETESIETSDLEQACNVQVSNYEDIVVPEKKNALDYISCNLGDVTQPVEPYPISSESDMILKHADISCYSSKPEDEGVSTSNGGKSARFASRVETKAKTGIVVGYEAQLHMKMMNTLVNVKELPCDDSSDHILQSQVPHDDCNQVVSTGLEGNYDSYLEDGELREHHWVDNGKNRESEHTDYDIHKRDENKFTDSVNGPVIEKIVAVVCEKQGNELHDHLRYDKQPFVEKNIAEDPYYSLQNSFLAGGDNVGEDCLKANPSTSNSILMTQLSAMENPEVVDMDLDDGRKSSIASDDYKKDANDCFKNIGDLYMDGEGMKDSRRELQSQIEGPLSSYRSGAHIAPRSRYSTFNHSYYRHERQIDVDESLGRGKSLNLDCGGRLGSRYWTRGLRSAAADPDSTVNDEKYVRHLDEESLGAYQQGLFPGSRGGYTHLVRKGSPTGGTEEYDTGPVKVQDISSENGQRNRYDRHLISALHRGPREGYRGPIYETPNSSSSMSNHFIKRERSFSPSSSRVDTHPPRGGQRRSRSRSRTQSPDLRPDDRIGRMRVQYQMLIILGKGGHL